MIVANEGFTRSFTQNLRILVVTRQTTQIIPYKQALFELFQRNLSNGSECTPPKTYMEPENAHVEKEKHRPKPPMCGFKMFIFGVAKLLKEV